MRAYEITLKNGKSEVVIGLRISVSAQFELKKKYKEEAVSSILSAVTDPEKMCYIFGLALNYKNNENQVTDGEEFYDLLVDNGFAGQADFMALLTSVAEFSGLINAKQKAKIDNFAKASVDEAFEEQFGENEEEDENEKNA